MRRREIDQHPGKIVEPHYPAQLGSVFDRLGLAEAFLGRGPAVGDEVDAPGSPVKRVVLERQRVFDRAAAGDRDVSGLPACARIGCRQLGVPFELAPQPACCRGDHIGRPARQAGNIHFCPVDDLDTNDAVRRDAGKLVEDRGRFAGGTLAIDQDIARCLAEAAGLFLHANLEARKVAQHVQRISRGEAVEIGGFPDPHFARDGDFGIGGVKWRRFLRPCGRGNECSDRCAQQQPVPHSASPIKPDAVAPTCG